MAGRIAEDTINLIREKADIVEIIESYIPLKKAGANFKAPCPFHNEKTPSFMVSPSKQIFHCFGCHEGGNVFSFIEKYEHISFREAVELLGSRLGVDIKTTEGEKKSTGENVARESHLKLHLSAAKHYQSNLRSAAGKQALGYLHQRGIDDETIEKFQLGYALESWDGLLKHVTAKGFNEQQVVDAGLAMVGQRNNQYDRFRNRIIFPIIDARENIVAFGGRVLDDSLPKYMNSPESAIYIKGKLLYGLNIAKRAILQNDALILLEGYMDLISLYQKGIHNVTASLGTALTSDHIRLIKRFTSNVFIVFDADDAGVNAMMRNSEMMAYQNLNVKITILPKDHDPDSYINAYGSDAFKSLLKNSKSVFQFKFDHEKKKWGIDSIESRVKILSNLSDYVSKVTNEVLKKAYIKQLAEDLNLDEGSIISEMTKSDTREKIRLKDNSELSKKTNELVKHEVLSEAETMFLGIIINEPHFFNQVSEQINIDELEGEVSQKVYGYIHKNYDAKKEITPSELITVFDGMGIASVISRCITVSSEISEKQKTLADCMKWIKKKSLEKSRRSLQTQLKQSENSGDEGSVFEIIKLITECDRKIKELIS